MKRLLYTLTAFMMMFSSCQKEVNVTERNDGNSSFDISAVLPSTMNGSRAMMTIPADRQLRFILEVRSKYDDKTTVKRLEQVSQNIVPAFKFDLPSDDYNVYMWADIIAKDADFKDGHYADDIYSTSNLADIEVKDYKRMFDTDLCDAYFGKMEINRNEANVSRSMKLERPFAKLVLKEKDSDMYNKLSKLEVSFKAMNKFNLFTGEPVEGVSKVEYTNESAGGKEGNELFSSYVFAPSSGSVTLSQMDFKFITTENMAVECVVPEGIVFERNQLFNATGELMSGGTGQPVPEPSATPQIGDFFFSDGTWNSVLTDANKANCVGVVYHVGALEGDDSDYDGKEVLGYVMGLKNVPVKASSFPGISDNKPYNQSGRPYFYKQGLAEDKRLTKKTNYKWTNYNGLRATQDLYEDQNYVNAEDKMDYPMMYVFKNWKENNVKQCENASEWYIPSAGQLYMASMRLFQGTYVLNENDKKLGASVINKEEALLTAFNKAVDLKVADAFASNNSGKGYYVWTSTLNNQSRTMTIQIGKEMIAKLYPFIKDNEGAQIRPFLTILKNE